MDAIFSAQAEGGVISSLLWKPDLIIEADYLEGEHFYDKSMGKIYAAIKEMFYSGASVDAFGIAHRLSDKLKDDKFNLPSIEELKQLGKDIARSNPNDYEALAREVYDDSYRRDLAERVAKLPVGDRRVNIEDLSTGLMNISEDLEKKYSIDREVPQFGKKISDIKKEIVKSREARKDGRLTWKWEALEDYAHLQTGELYLIEAKKKKGKSIFLMNQAVHFLLKGEPVLYFDTEMNDKLFYLRMMACVSHVDIKKIEEGNCTADEYKRYKAADEWLMKQPFYRIYTPEFDKAAAFRTCKKFRDQGVRVCIPDYIKSDGDSSEQNYNELGKLTNFWHNIIGGKLDMVVISAAQLNRQGETADSDKIERYASFGMKLDVKTKDEIERDGIQCGNFKAVVHFNRLGMSNDASDETDYIDLKFFGSTQRIESAEQHAAAEEPFE